MDCIVHGVTENQTRLSDFHFQTLFNLLLYWYFFVLNLNSFLHYNKDLLFSFILLILSIPNVIYYNFIQGKFSPVVSFFFPAIKSSFLG